jgi:signal transduction histidine kinase
MTLPFFSKNLSHLGALILLSSLGLAQAQNANNADATAAENMVTKGATALRAQGWHALVEMTAPRKTFVDRDLYLTVYDLEGKCKAHGQNPKQVAKNLINIKDPDGKLYIKERVEMAKTQNTFWQEYRYTNPITKMVQSKRAYCEKVDSLLVCGGVYK